MGAVAYVGGGSEPIEIAHRFCKLARHLKPWAAELTLAEQVAAKHGAEVSISDAAHQIGKVVGPDFKVVIYPHRTTAGNYHARVRDEGSKNKDRAVEVMRALDRAAGFNCTFSSKLK